MKKGKDENKNYYRDFTNKAWFTEGKQIKVGENIAKIMAGEFEVLNVKAIYESDTFKTWKIAITEDNQINLLKTSNELK